MHQRRGLAAVESEVEMTREQYGLSDKQFSRQQELLGAQMWNWPEHLSGFMDGYLQNTPICGDVAAHAIAEWVKLRTRKYGDEA